VPIIVLTGLHDETVGVSAVQEGAQDYLVKGQVDRNLLLRAMRYAVERKQAENMKDRFFSSVTHDLRIPLTAMQGYLSLFRDGLYGDLSEKQMRAIVALSQAGSSLLEMINSLLDFSKLRSGKYMPTMEPVDLEEVVNDVLEKITPLAEAKGLTLLRQFSQDFFLMKSDRRCLGQILMNLVGNAIKFTDHGSVKVSLKSVVKNSGLPAQMVQIRVEDTGCGIEARHLEKIFDEFYQVDMASQGTRPSTGLGLASCKRLAELLKGNVSVESKLGKGTTFSVMLPQEPLQG
jgi:signal transduction histidine kinase